MSGFRLVLLSFTPRPPARPPAQARPQVHIVGPRQRHHLKKRLFPNGSVQTPFFRLVFNARSRAKLKSHSRFLEVGGINLHSVSFCRAIFIHGVVLRKAGCLAFCIIIGCSRRLHDPVSMGVKSSRIWTAHPSCAGAPRYVVWILGNRGNFFGAWRSVLSA